MKLHRQMKALFPPIAILVFLVPVLSGGSIVYTYTGQPFTQYSADASCPPTCNLAGEFSLPVPLGDNLDYDRVTPESFSFTDGLNVWDAPSELLAIEISTNSVGEITQWLIELENNDQEYWLSEFTNFDPTTDESYSCLGSCYQYYMVNYSSPGTWTITSEVPEPAAWMLVPIGLLAIWLGKRRGRHDAINM